MRVPAPPAVPLGADQHMLAESGKMMTTDRTAIRRRLAIRRTAHRPPSGGWKAAGHRSILAPIAATIAATVAVGVGVAIAKAGRDRRTEREEATRPAARASARRDSAGRTEADGALAGRRGDRPAPGERHHREPEGGPRDAQGAEAAEGAREGARGRAGQEGGREGERGAASTARLLAGARDAEVLLDTLDALIARHPGKLARRKSVARLRRRLAAERDSAQRRALGDPATRARAIGELRAFRERVIAWDLSGRDGIVIVEPGLIRLYSQGRRRWRRVEAGKGERVREMHEWRKRVKDLRYIAEMLSAARQADQQGRRAAAQDRNPGRRARRTPRRRARSRGARAVDPRQRQAPPHEDRRARRARAC